MRNLLAIMLAVVTGLLAVASVAAWRVDTVLHTPETLEQIASESADGPALRESAPELIGSAAGSAVDEAVPGFAQDMVSSTTESLASDIVADPGFDAAWAASLEQTRTGWVEQLREVRTALDAGDDVAADAGQLQLDISPLAGLSADVVTGSLQEAVEGIPFGDQLSGVIDEVSGEIPDELTVATDLPPAEHVTARHLAFAESTVGYWWLVGAAAVVSVLVSLLVARRKALVWLVTGVTVAAAGWLTRGGLEQVFADTIAGAQGTAEAGVVESLVGGFRTVVLPDTVALILGGGVLIAIGLVTMLVSVLIRR